MNQDILSHPLLNLSKSELASAIHDVRVVDAAFALVASATRDPANGGDDADPKAEEAAEAAWSDRAVQNAAMAAAKHFFKMLADAKKD